MMMMLRIVTIFNTHDIVSRVLNVMLYLQYMILMSRTHIRLEEIDTPTAEASGILGSTKRLAQAGLPQPE